jgi:nucleoside-diphosphate-sugar epimerase
MRVLLTGGTGFIGRAPTVALKKRQDDVAIVSRHASPECVPWHDVETKTDRYSCFCASAARAAWTQARSPRSLHVPMSSRISLSDALPLFTRCSS